ncbi:hypothetical protein G6O67_002746 [Ophiocordyceps sinensis]|uniref:F-box domain-containing protein n=2 Tax=Ophiocordyceps sinensis TaxID=72228 RepID=A0A8H4PV89_9HYPO|nr:hypothetical protein OCS_06739 [Ophiocordyceps sinensis CO18]KAF4510898.1 hypothetical protein G6O67_002746 [Ophiocordyceps sinensis]
MESIDRAFHRLARKMNHWQRLPDGEEKPRQQGQRLTDSTTRQALASDKVKEQSLTDSTARQPLASDKAKEQSLTDSETRQRLAKDKARQQESCALLQLPLKLILYIADKLGQSEQVLLSQSCSRLRFALLPRCGPSNLLPLGKMLNFLTCMARNLPEHYACHSRRKICLIDYKFDRMSGRTCRAPYTVSPLELVDGNPFFEISRLPTRISSLC